MKMTKTENVKEQITDFLLVGVLLIVFGFVGSNLRGWALVWGFGLFFALTRWPRGVRHIVDWRWSWAWYSFAWVLGGFAVPEWIDWASGRAEFHVSDYTTWGGVAGIVLVLFFGLLLLLIHRGSSGRKD